MASVHNIFSPFPAFCQLLAEDHLSGRGHIRRRPQFLMVTAVGLAFFTYSLALFRKSIAVTK
jgi:hypothetical protein